MKQQSGQYVIFMQDMSDSCSVRQTKQQQPPRSPDRNHVDFVSVSPCSLSYAAIKYSQFGTFAVGSEF